MLIIPKIIIVFMILNSFPIQKEKDKCLIISMTDNREVYQIGTIGNQGENFYILLKYPDISKEKKSEKLNPILSIGVEMNPTGTSYNLENREEIKNLPDNISDCNCATLNNFNLGMEFKLYVQKDDSWITFDAKKLLVEE